MAALQTRSTRTPARRWYRRKRAARRIAVSAKDQAAELIECIEREYLARVLSQRRVLLVITERVDHPDQLRLFQENRLAFRRDRSVENDVEGVGGVAAVELRRVRRRHCGDDRIAQAFSRESLRIVHVIDDSQEVVTPTCELPVRGGRRGDCHF